MKKVLTTLVFILFLTPFSSFAQTDSILCETSLSGFKFYHHTIKIKNKQVLKMLEVHDEAYEILSSGVEAYTFGNIFSVVGIGLIIAPAVVSLAGIEIEALSSNWSMAWAGGAVLLISVPLHIKYRRSTITAINLYNSELPESKKTSALQPRFNIGTTQNGIGLIVSF